MSPLWRKGCTAGILSGDKAGVNTACGAKQTLWRESQPEAFRYPLGQSVGYYIPPSLLEIPSK